MDSFTVYLDDDKITPSCFFDWVDRTSRKLQGIYYTGDYQLSQSGCIVYKSNGTVSIESTHLKFLDDQHAIVGDIEIIEIQALQLGKRLKVTVGFLNEPEHIPYLGKFISEIKKDWPGAFPTISISQATSEIKPNQPEKVKPLTKIQQACIEWAGRPAIPSQNMDEFLNDISHEDKYNFIGKDQFKAALKEAGKAGLIVKVNGRWRLPPKT